MPKKSAALKKRAGSRKKPTPPLPPLLELYKQLAPKVDEALVDAIIDTPGNCRYKMKLDNERGLYKVSYLLPPGLVFPYNFGFIPGTKGEDGDALDVVVVMEESLPCGMMVSARIVGVLEAKQTQNGETLRNDRFIAVAECSHRFRSVKDLRDLDSRIMAEIEQFFVTYNRFRGRRFTPMRRSGKRKALSLIEQGLRAARRRKR